MVYFLFFFFYLSSPTVCLFTSDISSFFSFVRVVHITRTISPFILDGCPPQFQRFISEIYENQAYHMPTPERLEIRKMMENIKARVNRETTAVGQIYTEELARANLSTAALAIPRTTKKAST
jgi:hypothetical protein